jgi:translocation and assembly module TamB
MRRRFATGIALLISTILLVTAALAQPNEESRFVRFLEGMLSTPERQVSISGLEGVFSSTPRVQRITVSDAEGIWLELEDVELVWTRTALFSRMLDINSLTAQRVAMLRSPVSTQPASGSSGYAPPPIAIEVESFSLPNVKLGAAVAGTEAELTMVGSLQLTEAAIAVQLRVDRQDRAGALTADLRLEPQANVLTAELSLEEPAGGLVAEMLRLRGRPEIALTLSGAGPLSDWGATLEMQAGGSRVLVGSVGISRISDGYRIVGDFAAALESVAPEDYAALFAGESRLALDFSRADSGAIAIQSSTIRSEGAELAASGRFASDLVPESAEFSVRLGQAGRIPLPFIPGDVTVAGFEATGGIDAGDAAPWRVDASAQGVQSARGEIGSVVATASGQAANLAAPNRRSASFRIDGSADGVALADSAMREAIGPTVRLTGAGSWAAGSPVTFETLQVVLTGATASFAGTAAGGRLDGSFGATIVDLSRFRGLSGRPIAGSAQLQASGTVGLDGAFDLRLDGEASDLALGIAALDPLLVGSTLLAGGMGRADGALRFDQLAFTNERATAELDGAFAAPALDLSLTGRVADLSLVTPRAGGAAEISARLTGTRAEPQVEAAAMGTNVVLMGRPLNDASARFSGIVSGPRASGEAEVSGMLADAPVHGTARLTAGGDGARRLDQLRFSVGESALTGTLTIGADRLFTGDLSLVSPDLSQVAPLFLVEAEGMLRADIALGPANGAQAASFSVTATDILYEGITLETLEAQGQANDLFAALQLEGNFALRNLAVGGLDILAADGTASRRGSATIISGNAALADGSATLAATLEPRGGGLVLALQTFAFSRPGIDLALAAPSTIQVQNGAARFDTLALNAGGGSATIAGIAGEQLDLRIALNAVPASLVNSFSPELGAEGRISGNVAVRGSAAAPNASFDISVADASVAASRNAGIGPVGMSTQGSLAGDTVNLSSQISGADGLSVRVTGTAGTAPEAPLDLSVTGAMPLSLGNRQLASRGAALQGALDLDVAVSGTVSAPRFSGRVTSEGGGFVDPDTGIVLRNVSLSASFSRDRLIVDRLAAQSGEGTVTGAGSIGLDPTAGFPVDLELQVRQARYVDGTMIAARFDADLTLTGNFSEGPLLSGTVFLDRTEITVPERLPRDSVAVDVQHLAPPLPVTQTLALARNPDRRAGGEARASSGIRLDLTIRAPRQIFVRGRGIDTELGGEVRLTGPLSSVLPVGAFEMVRGRLDILTQRIAFDRGIITFAGDLDPILDFSGTTRSGDVTITVTVSGRASDPEVFFSSIPELPQDEVLAQLIFQKGIGELSPVQIARLGAAAAELSGGSGGVLGQLRQSTGLDDLDIVMDEEGAPAVAAGRYVSENVYIGVQQGATTDSTRVTIDLDITDNVKARAGMSPTGDSSLGIFFEREY